VGRGIDWGFSPPHTLLPKEEKEEKKPFCVRHCKKGAVKRQWFFFSLKDFKDDENSI